VNIPKVVYSELNGGMRKLHYVGRSIHGAFVFEAEDAGLRIVGHRVQDHPVPGVKFAWKYEEVPVYGKFPTLVKLFPYQWQETP
jgi:hypothetical protein